MSQRITEPPSVKDSMSPGDTIIGHEAAFYRDGSLTASHRPRPAVPGYEAPQAAPSEPALPMLGVARAVAGRHIQKLRAEAGNIERDLQRGIIGPGGNVTEHLVTRQREARVYLEQVQEEITRLEQMTDEQVRQFAYDKGAR
jgi:hypothetical protein